MILVERAVAVRLILWLPLACFVALLATMATVNILPPDHHLTYAVVEWVEMVVGTVSAVIAFVIVFLRPSVVLPAVQIWRRYKLLAICGLGVWCIFWLIALLARPFTD